MSNKSNNLTYNVGDYTRLTEIQAVLHTPDVYIGSDKWSERKDYFYPRGGENRIILMSTSIPYAIEKCFEEVIQNAGDNYNRSIKSGLNAKNIIVQMDQHYIKITNFGKVIPLETNQYGDGLVPDMIFSQMHSGANLDKTKVRKGSGKNGMGVKLVNIFSKWFKVEIRDSVRRRFYTKTWINNMSEFKDYKLEENVDGENETSVTYMLDFERFGIDGYTDEFFALFRRISADLANTWKVEVIFNGESFNFKNSLEHAKLYFPLTNNTISFKIPTKDGRDILADVVLIDTPNDNHLIAYTNSTLNIEGGNHVNKLIKAISVNIIEEFKKKFKLEKKKEDDKFRITSKDIKNNISFIANFFLDDPMFGGQTKTKLTTNVPDITLDQNLFSSMSSWSIMNRLYSIYKSKDMDDLKLTDGKNKRIVNLPKLRDANEAGDKRRLECTLIICEGDSARGYVSYLIDLIENGLEFFGSYPLRGKLLNVMNATPQQLLENKETAEIKAALGLQEGVDYSIPENYAKLRYGRVMILTDADLDGYHIKGLAYTFFFVRFPSLFQANNGNFFVEMTMKILRIRVGKKMISFHNTQEYDLYIHNHPEHAKIKPAYFKGLGSSNKEEIADDYKTSKQIVIYLDEEAPIYINLAFNKDRANDRKKWLDTYYPRITPIDTFKRLSDFIDNELIEFSISDNVRSIPKFTDGFKRVQRMIMYNALLIWGKGKKELMNTASFQTKTKDKCNYHHAGQAMMEATAGMAFDFVGSNNIPYFYHGGNFGSRQSNGKDRASDRYTSTRLNSWVRYVFREEDSPLYNYVIDEGQKCEPESLYPIIPMELINGAVGIGTAYSTFIPNHNPLDVIAWLEAKINNKPLPTIYPWYKGFNGSIYLVNKKTGKEIVVTQGNSIVKDESYRITINSGMFNPVINGVYQSPDSSANPEEDEEILPVDDNEELSFNNGHIQMVTTGHYEIINYKVYIRELPIGRWTQPYIAWLNSLAGQKIIDNIRLIDDNKKHFTEHPQFEISGFEKPSLKSLRLIKSYGLTNMVLLDQNNRPKKFESVIDILETFYKFRLDIYTKRKEYQLNQIKDTINRSVERFKYIKDIVDQKLEVRNRPKTEIFKDMDKLGHPHYLYESVKGEIDKSLTKSLAGKKKVGISELSEDTIIDLKGKINKLLDDLEKLQNTAPGEIWLRELKEFKDIYLHKVKKGKL